MESTSEAFQHGTRCEEKERHELYVTPVQQKQNEYGTRARHHPRNNGSRRKNSTRARLHQCTMDQGGRTVQELDFIPVQWNKKEEQYKS